MKNKDKQLTAVQMAMKIVQETADEHEDPLERGILSVICDKVLKPLLNVERKQTENAFIAGSKSGFASGSSAAMGIKGGTTAQDDFEKYFSETFVNHVLGSTKR